MRNALIGGSLVAVAAGLLGYFVITRQNAFAAHALAHIGFPGATGAILIGAPVTLGPGRLLRRRRPADRPASAGGWPTGRWPPARSSRWPPRSASCSPRWPARTPARRRRCCSATCWRSRSDQLRGLRRLHRSRSCGTLAVLARPLVFASVDPAVAEARGVPVRALGLAFVVLLALTITMAVQVVGTLLLFALVVTPAATALRITARPARVAAARRGARARRRCGAGWCSSAMVDLPPSFFIVSLAVLAWVVVLAAVGAPDAAAPSRSVDTHHPH